MEAPPTIALPANIRGQLRRFRRGLWRMETLVAVLGAGCGLLAAYLLLFISDRFWETPVWLRVGLAAGSVVCCAWFAGYWLDRWGWHRRDARQLAVLVQHHYPRIGDRLLGIVELADGARQPANVSPALCRAAMQQVAAEVGDLDFQQAVPTRRRRTWLVAFAGLVGAVLVGLVCVPRAGVNAWQRFCHPLAAIGRYTLVRLEKWPASRIVPYGEPFTVQCRLAADSRWSPDHARCRLDRQEPITSSAANGAFSFAIPGQTRPGMLAVEVGDARARLEIRPTFRPDLVSLRAAIEWPAYLGYPPLTEEVRDGVVEILAGSQVALAGQVSRPLAAATLGATPLAVTADRFAAPARVVTNTQRLALSWRDELGLTGREPLALNLTVRPDEAPTVSCRGIDRVVAVLEDEVIEFTVAAEDDFGVRAIGLVWETEGNPALGVAATNGVLAIRPGSQCQKELTGPVRFAPLTLGLGPQRVTVRGTATDYLPGRAPSLSPPCQIYILDRLEHAKLVQQQFEKLQEKLEEVARTEADLFETNQRLPRAAAAPEAAARFAEQQQAEEANTATLHRLEADALKLLKEALRNKLIDPAVLRQWAELLAKLAPVSEQEMPDVARLLGRAQTEPTQRAGRLNEALTRQQQVLSELTEALRQMDRTGNELLAGSFVNRLRQAAAAETGIGAGLGKLVPETIGVPASQLPEPLKIKISGLEDQQRRNQQQVRYIRDDLEHFFNRTRENLFGNVQQEMVQTRVVEELEKLAEAIAQNASGESIAAATSWAGQLEQWAKKLAPAGENNGGEGGGGAGEMSPAALELLMKLMRARLTEEGLRDQTRFLEEHKTGNEQYAAGAERLTRIQAALGDTVAALAERVGAGRLGELLDDVGGAMRDAARLLGKPQTDGETVAAETEAIELLASALENAGGGASARASQGLLALLRRLLGNGLGGTGGGSNRGGDTDNPNSNSRGRDAGRPAEHRPVTKTGGRDAAAFPAEFREAIEAYLNVIEGAR